MNIKYINMIKKNKSSGFTLLELLIVIAILAILSVALVLVLNPAETLKKARDSQRISDLSTIKTAIGLYMTTVSPAYLGGVNNNNFCKDTPLVGAVWGVNPATSKISYSYTGATLIADTSLDSSTLASFRQLTTVPLASVVDGSGWIPVKFSDIPGGSPISNIPLDPTNTMTAPATAVAFTDLVYRYGCSVTPLSFEIDAQLESDAYTVTDDKRASDGGNTATLYEVGTNLLILGTGSNNF
ncbi:MAG: type II secretion system protein [bacterium]